MKLIFNPFYKIAGVKALLVGMIVMIITLAIAPFSLAAFDGVLDFHVIRYSNRWYYVAVYLLSWLSMISSFAIAGIAFSKTNFRWIDLIGTTLLSRVPLLLISVLGFMVPEINIQMTKDLTKIHFSAFAISAIIISLICIIWEVALLYNSYRVSLNIKGDKAIWSFIITLLAAEILSLALIHYFIK